MLSRTRQNDHLSKMNAFLHDLPSNDESLAKEIIPNYSFLIYKRVEHKPELEPFGYDIDN